MPLCGGSLPASPSRPSSRTGHLLPADDRARPRRRRRCRPLRRRPSRHSCSWPRVVGGGATALWHLRPRASAPRRRRRQPEPRRQPRHRRARPCAAWTADGTAQRPLPRRRAGRCACGRARRPPGEHVIAAVMATGWSLPRASPRPEPEARRKPPMEVVALVLARHRRHLHLPDLQDRAAAERLGGRAARQVPPHADAGTQLPHSLHRPRRLQALAEGDPARRAEPGLHHARQHPAAGRRHPLLPGHRPDARQLRLVELHRRHHPAGADLAAQRDRQDGARQDLRGARPRSTPRSSARSTKRR